MTEPIKGFDVSHHQDPAAVPWAELKRLGYQWCYIRAAYGAKRDRRFTEHVAQAQRHGIEWGPYLYLRQQGGISTRQQVGAFVDALNGTNPQLYPCLDIEEREPGAGYLDGARDGAEDLTKEFGNCVIYTGAVYRIVHNLIDWSTEYPEWIADYDGDIYGFGLGDGYPAAHQHTGKGRVGKFQPLDLNVAHDLDAFRIEPRAVEVVADRVPELCSLLQTRLDAIAHYGAQERAHQIDGLLTNTDRLAQIIEQDAEAARGKP